MFNTVDGKLIGIILSVDILSKLFLVMDYYPGGDLGKSMRAACMIANSTSVA
mgnify:CR=1 FL=1